MSNDVKKAAADFLLSARVLILARHNAERAVLRSAFMALGAGRDSVLVTKEFEEARKFIEANRPTVIVSEFEIDERFGLELSLIQRDHYPDLRDKVFFLISNDGESSAVSDAAEEEVEAFIIKPIQEDAVIRYFEQAIQKKLHPSPYSKKIQEARNLIAQGQMKEAMGVLNEATFLHESPSLANYYLGYIYEHAKKFEDALRFYDLGLSYSPEHFKCMYGKFMCLYKLDKKDEAFKIVSQIRVKYPLTPEILKYALIVVVLTYNFREVESYYELFLRQRRKPDDLKHVVSAALLTAAKVLLREKKDEQALNYFRKGAVISGRQEDYIKNVVETLIKSGFTAHCVPFLDMFKPDEAPVDLIRRLRFKQFVKENRNPDFLLKEGRQLMFDGIADEFTADKVLSIAVEQNNTRLISTLAQKATELFPASRDKYVAFMK